MQSTRTLTEIKGAPGNPQFVIQVEDERGIHSETIGLATLTDVLARGIDIDVPEDLADVFNAYEYAYIEIAQEQDYYTEKTIYDVYRHGIAATYFGLQFDAEGELLKTYKQKKSAETFARKQSPAVILN